VLCGRRYAVATTVYAVATTVYAVATTLTCSTRGGSAEKGPTISRHRVNAGEPRKPSVWSPRFAHRTRSTERWGQHLKHFNDGLGRGAGDATNRLLQHAHLRLSHIRSIMRQSGEYYERAKTRPGL